MDQTCLRHTSKLLVALLLSGLMTGVAWAQAPKQPAATPPAAVSPAPAASKSAGPTVETPEPPDKVVLKVGDQQFTKADIDFLIQNLPPQTQHAIATQGKKPLGDQYALIVMLSQRAHAHHLDERPDLIQKLAFQRKQMEAQIAFEELSQQAKVTPEDVQQYYTAHAADYDEVTMRQFVVRMKAAEPKADPAHPTAPTGLGLAPEEAKARAAAIRKEVAAGTDIKKVIEDFKAPGDIIIEADPRAIRHKAMRPEMEKVAFALKDGEISEPVEVPGALVFFQVTKHGHAELKDVSPEIEKSLQKPKIDAALDAVKKNATLWMDEQYFAAPPKLADVPGLGAPVGPQSVPVVKAPPKP
jgi:parvulin-like peptidyl-prolyl isomerase